MIFDSPILRWSCYCGRFISEQDICERDYRDPGAYYGISTETHYHCSRCGMVRHDPRLTEIASYQVEVDFGVRA